MTILLQWNPSFGETPDWVHFSCRKLCWKVIKYDAYTLRLTESVYELLNAPYTVNQNGVELTQCKSWMHSKSFFFKSGKAAQKQKIESYYYKWSNQFDKKTPSPPHMDGSIVFARWRQYAPHLTYAYLDPPWANIPNSISISSAVFAQLTAEVLYTLQWAAHSPLKIAILHGGSDSSLI